MSKFFLSYHCYRAFIAMILLLPSLTAVADPAAPDFKKTGYLESDIGYSSLTANYSDWFDQYLKGRVQLTPTDGVNMEYTHQSHFNEEGSLGSLGYQRIFNEDWYGSISAATSSSGSFLPRYRGDVSLYRKWLSKKNLVTGVGFTYNQSRLANYDQIVLLDIIYYFDAPWIVELGGRLVESNPGSVASERGFVAVTYGSNKSHFLTLKYDQGTEGWQAVGATQTIANFGSYEVTMLLRQWITNDYGFSLAVNHYSNPNYNRSGIIAGIFVDF